MDRYTALSGSGSAYVFLFLEAMIDAATRLGLSETKAKAFCLQTFRGAVEMAQTSTVEIAALRQQVTSSGGTTAAAIEQFEKEGLNQTVFHAMQAAYVRAQTLSTTVSG